jgi:hypothetical protein
MTGLNLETFLQLLRADIGAWLTLGLIVGLLGLMAWTSWGSRRALRKCLVLSIAAHVGLVIFGGSNPGLFLAGGGGLSQSDQPKLRSIRVATLRPDGTVGPDVRDLVEGKRAHAVSWEQPVTMQGPVAAELDPTLRADRPELDPTEPTRQEEPDTLRPEAVAPEIQLADAGSPAARASEADVSTEPNAIAPDVADVGLSPPSERSNGGSESKGSEKPAVPELEVGRRQAGGGVRRPVDRLVLPEVDPLREVRASNANGHRDLPKPDRSLLALTDRGALGGMVEIAPFPETRGVGSRRSIDEVPPVYRSRLDPNRSARARLAGATEASEQAVERALAWLSSHQDQDGRWDAGTARYGDGTVAPGEGSFTKHCPPGDVCHGECFYWEADTAVTGLALLTFLGAGYTHIDGKYAGTVAKGVDFLLTSQKPDGDLRGRSKAVGMYCHAMATLALSEALALSGDARLQQPVERAVSFLVDAQYPELMGWRYAPAGEISRKPTADRRNWEYSPHPPVGDTSVLGWVVLVLKSASVVDVAVPATARDSALNWLKKVADGPNGGLARYQPSRPPDPTMTAEAWLCRQFLGVGGSGPASDEAAAYLLASAPTSESFNIYYLYYGTLALYQHGGQAWTTWNGLVRDQLIGRQHLTGHKAGSWDPDGTRYGTHGGRLYTTALAALSLEVYYRYLRLYDQPASTDFGIAPLVESDPVTRPVPPLTEGSGEISRRPG